MSSGDRLRDGRDDGGQRFSRDDPDFESFLRALKRHGCNLLVTGEAGEEAFAAMTRRLLGVPSQRRVRLLALTNARIENVERLLPDGIGATGRGVEVLRHGSAVRGTAATDISPGTSSPPQSELVAFQDDVCDAVGTEGLTPGELRVGVVNLCPFVSDYGTEAVAEFARTVGSEVLRAHGMAHYCLPAVDDAPVVAELQPEFDARIEVRKGNDSPPTHRWHVPQHDLTTPWVEI